LYRRLGGPQSRSGHEARGKILCPAGDRTSIARLSKNRRFKITYMNIIILIVILNLRDTSFFHSKEMLAHSLSVFENRVLKGIFGHGRGSKNW
jgi:hypothetical protein